ncbi:hypothetical protein NL676_009731 [Syzygium grande]|nr:hypothetical protein NL676_009731 [Syzygium grande]
MQWMKNSAYEYWTPTTGNIDYGGRDDGGSDQEQQCRGSMRRSSVPGTSQPEEQRPAASSSRILTKGRGTPKLPELLGCRDGSCGKQPSESQATRPGTYKIRPQRKKSRRRSPKGNETCSVSGTCLHPWGAKNATGGAVWWDVKPSAALWKKIGDSPRL